jgi:hypothetical protein
MKKLHLGCGERYLEGYINIDYPPSEHTIQENPKVDLYADITKLKYEPESISEIRLHHVFEHFDRTTALNLLIDWHDWLEVGGILIIETPDYFRSTLSFLFGSKNTRAKNLRHIFGSQEAPWALHYDGWYKSKFKLFLSKLGFSKLRFKRNHWHGTHNITVFAKKTNSYLKRSEQIEVAKFLLEKSMVDKSPTELKMHQVWFDKIKK